MTGTTTTVTAGPQVPLSAAHVCVTPYPSVHFYFLPSAQSASALAWSVPVSGTTAPPGATALGQDLSSTSVFPAPCVPPLRTTSPSSAVRSPRRSSRSTACARSQASSALSSRPQSSSTGTGVAGACWVTAQCPLLLLPQHCVRLPPHLLRPTPYRRPLCSAPCESPLCSSRSAPTWLCPFGSPVSSWSLRIGVTVPSSAGSPSVTSLT